MLRLTGAALVFFGCALWGMRAADGLRRRVRLLEELAGVLDTLERELTLNRRPLPELFEQLSNYTCGTLSDLFCTCKSEIEKGNNFTAVWDRIVGGLSFDEAEGSLLRGLGQVLGRYDDREQSAAVSRIRCELERRLIGLREDSRSRGKMYRVLGAAGGGFLVAVLL